MKGREIHSSWVAFRQVYSYMRVKSCVISEKYLVGPMDRFSILSFVREGGDEMRKDIMARSV